MAEICFPLWPRAQWRVVSSPSSSIVTGWGTRFKRAATHTEDKGQKTQGQGDLPVSTCVCVSCVGLRILVNELCGCRCASGRVCV